MLDGTQLKSLKTLLLKIASDQKNGAPKTNYRDIAEQLSKQLQSEVTPDSVRHYVRKWRSEPGLSVQICARGWRKGRTREKAGSGDSRQPALAFLYREVLALTGWSVIRLHSELGKLGVEGLPARRTLQEQIARTGALVAQLPFRSRTSGLLTERFVLRVQQVALTRFPGKNYWILMAAYEVQTGFLNLNLLDLSVKDGKSQGRGRPKVIKVDEPVGHVVRGDKGDFVRINGEIWKNFLAETLTRLGLPVTRVEYVSNFGLEPTILTHGESEVHVVSACKGGSDVLSYQVSDDVLKTLPSKLTLLMRTHNQARRKELENLREKLASRLKDARREGGPKFRDGIPDADAAERYALLDYYQGMDRENNLKIERLVCHLERGWIHYEPAENAAPGDILSPPRVT